MNLHRAEILAFSFYEGETIRTRVASLVYEHEVEDFVEELLDLGEDLVVVIDHNGNRTEYAA